MATSSDDVLSLDSDNEYDSGSDMERRSSDRSIIHIGVNEYRKFQLRLRQLEEICQQQARKQAKIEAMIEAEVQARTKKVEEAMQKKIETYKREKELECEREVQKRVSLLENGSLMTKAFMGKLFRSRGAQGRSESVRNPERCPAADSTEQSLDTSLHDAEENDIGPDASLDELVDNICVLRRHVSVQDQQLDQAKSIITAAIESSEEAEATAREAVELTLALDSRLERVSREMGAISDELRQSESFSSAELITRISGLLSHRSASESMKVKHGASSPANTTSLRSEVPSSSSSSAF